MRQAVLAPTSRAPILNVRRSNAGGIGRRCQFRRRGKAIGGPGVGKRGVKYHSQSQFLVYERLNDFDFLMMRKIELI